MAELPWKLKANVCNYCIVLKKFAIIRQLFNFIFMENTLLFAYSNADDC